MRKKNIKFHIQSNDYFGTLATRVDLLLQDINRRGITPEMYDKKLKEYKSKQSNFLQQMQEYSVADEQHHLTASRLLDVCNRAVEIFESSEPQEKRQFLNFVLQNSVLNGTKPMFTLKPVFAGIVKAHQTGKWLAGLDDVRTILNPEGDCRTHTFSIGIP